MVRKDVMDDLLPANWVSVKIDAVSEDVWRKINRPHSALELYEILTGILKFSRAFTGVLVTETMLIRGINIFPDELNKIADFISGINSKKSYLSIPTRPPAEPWVQPADEHDLSAAYGTFTDRAIDTECLIGVNIQ